MQKLTCIEFMFIDQTGIAFILTYLDYLCHGEKHDLILIIFNKWRPIDISYLKLYLLRFILNRLTSLVDMDH